MAQERLMTVSCNKCGGPLEVGENTRYVTCRYCSSRLEVHGGDGSVYTEVLEAIESKTKEIAENVEALKLQHRLEQIDREWMLERQQYEERDRQGKTRTPTKAGAVIQMTLVVIVAIVWMTITTSRGMTSILPLAGLVAIVLAVVMGFSGITKASQYEHAERRYRERRGAVVEDMRRRGG